LVLFWGFIIKIKKEISPKIRDFSFILATEMFKNALLLKKATKKEATKTIKMEEDFCSGPEEEDEFESEVDDLDLDE